MYVWVLTDENKKEGITFIYYVIQETHMSIRFYFVGNDRPKHEVQNMTLNDSYFDDLKYT